MSLANTVLFRNDDLPIRVCAPVHSGKVRAVYWLDERDSRRLVAERGYAVAEGTPLGVMVISDRISAFDCIWRGEQGLDGIPGKGAALNAISRHWFDLIGRAGIGHNHILDVPHPLVWVVQRARPIRVEAIARQYITGSLARGYAKGERSICGIALPDGLQANQRLPELLITPSTKGILRGVPGVPEQDDVNITRENITGNLSAFGFDGVEDVERYESLLSQSFALISAELDKLGQIFVDTKLEFGYGHTRDGKERLMLIDEVGTPDSSRIWDGKAYAEGRVVERSKEGFRQFLLGHLPEPDVLLDKQRMAERTELAASTRLPVEAMLEVSRTYTGIAEEITGSALPTIEEPKQQILEALSGELKLLA